VRTRVKICGVRRVEDARLAVELGAEWVGCVRAVDSPRYASLREVAAIRRAVEGRARVVLVGRVRPEDEGESGAAGEEFVLEAKCVGASAVQIHGASRASLERVRDAGLIAWTVVSIARDATRLPGSLEAAREDGAPFLLDVGAGGSGTPFDWRLLGDVAPPGTFIAGGITPENVADLLARAPFGIDVSSGIERSPGIKDARRMRQLFAALAEVEA